ncbi:MAG: hypothetical protein VKJ64_22075 [Leptolyngbyaceae bacterium]|nr:hypothetical protein [Leptolyngbyaceae bacterium]
MMLATSAAAMYEKLEAISEEGAIACVAVGLISTVATLIAAPWPFHLLLVLMILALRFRLFRDLPNWRILNLISFTSNH